MAKDVADVLGNAIGKIAREAAQSLAQNDNHKSSASGLVDKVSGNVSERMKNVSGTKGVAAGVAAATLVPLAAKGAGKLVRGVGGDGGGLVQKAGDKVGGKVKGAVGDQVDKQVDKAGGAAGIAKEGAKGLLPGGGGKKKGVPGVGKGRRMPIQQDIDIGVPISTVYNQWTQFEEWPNFMHRLQSVSQDDETHVKFKTKIWGISKEFTAEITEQRPDERIKWEVTEGVTHTGVVTFHELGPRLTRVELNLDVQPGSLIEKAARGMRHVKRAVRADMARFKAYILMSEEEDGEWRGEIEDGDVKSTRSSSGSSSGSGSRASSSGSGSRSSSSGSGSGSSRSRGSSSRGSSSSSRGSSSGGSSSGARKSSSRGSSSGARKSSSRGSSSSSRGSSSSSRGSSSSSRGSSSGARKSSSGTRSRASSSGSGSRSTSGRSSGSSSSRSSSAKKSSNGRGRTTASSNGRSRSSSSNGRSSSSRSTRSSSNGGSGNGRSSRTAAKKRSGSRS